mmetsp:Transcript_137364/g.238917  ORF Transcript_137364/g.238917 Transcript_137364/m.238917 type:complete len:93 (-) Transcript_137364:272-550(-)
MRHPIGRGSFMRVLPTSQLFLLHCVTLFCVAVERPAMFIIRRCACATHTLQAVHRTGQGEGGFVGAGRDWALALPSQSCRPTRSGRAKYHGA